jgi:hypothetical protein
LRAYLKRLELYYVDVLERPDKLDRFKLLDFIHPPITPNGPSRLGGFAPSQSLRGEHVMRVLAEHRQLLLIEQKKQADGWHDVFRQLLHEAMSNAGHSLRGAAEEMRIDRATLGDYLSGKRNDLRVDTKIKMRNYSARPTRPANRPTTTVRAAESEV